MASTEGLVPITRTFLSKFYDKYPIEPFSPEMGRLEAKLEEESRKLAELRSSLVHEDDDVIKLLDADVPHKIDENLWKNREQLEEIIFLLDKENWPEPFKAENIAYFAEAASKWTELTSTQLQSVEEYQKFTSEKVFEMVITYLPQDLRGTLVRLQRERSERRRQAEIETLLASGGTIKEKYALLWQQQMDRRQTLASLGSATGVYKTLVQYLVGVPQVLLDFVRQINDHNGPMEEQRDRYGPHLYRLTSFVRKIRVFLAMLWEDSGSQLENLSAFTQLLTESIDLYTREFSRVLGTLRTVFENAPFLISAEDALSADEKSAIEAFKEVTVSSGAKFELSVDIDIAGSAVAWEFSLVYGKDVGFSVEFSSNDGQSTEVVAYQRIDSHEGTFNAPGVGSYLLVWDNSYSFLTSKTVKYKVGSMPPVVSEEQFEAEEALAHHSA